MINGINSALTALDAFFKKMDVASNNVANIISDGFKKSRAVIEEGENGGVTVSIQKIDTPGSAITYEDGSGVQTKEGSNVDFAEEAVNMILAQRGFEANLKSLKTQSELLGTFLDIVD